MIVDITMNSETWKDVSIEKRDGLYPIYRIVIEGGDGSVVLLVNRETFDQLVKKYREVR